MFWILIIFASYRGGVATAEFNNEQACRTAAQQVAAMNPKFASTVTERDVLCVPKGVKQ